MSKGAELVVRHFSRMVEPDGGSVELVSVEGATLTVRYRPGVNEECADCVLEPDDLRALMQEALERQDPAITEVKLEAAPGNG